MPSTSAWGLPFILGLCVLVLLASSWLGKLGNRLFLPASLSGSFGARGFFFKLAMIVLSVGCMRVLGHGELRSFGFLWPGGFDWLGFAWRSAAVLAAGFVVFLAMVIAGARAAGKEPTGFPRETFLHQVLFIWIWSSLAETVLTRGLLQSYLTPLGHLKVTLASIPISLPVLVSALFFSAMHLGLLRKFTPSFVVAILFDTLIVGLVAAHYREKSGSLVPAVLAHMMGNIIGSLPLLLTRFAKA